MRYASQTKRESCFNCSQRTLSETYIRSMLERSVDAIKGFAAIKGIDAIKGLMSACLDVRSISGRTHGMSLQKPLSFDHMKPHPMYRALRSLAKTQKQPCQSFILCPESIRP